jgi:hypothetical protein
MLFLFISIATAWTGRGTGIIVGHFLVAVAVAFLDLRWIQSEMHQPGWNGQPDQDFVFMIGVLLRIVLVNTVLLPVSLLGLRLARKRVPRIPKNIAR